MKFVYGYKTSGNERREGVISASSRDDAYAELKKQGIRPFRVELAPGLVNKMLSIGKRGFVIVVLALLVLAACAVIAWLAAGTDSRQQDADVLVLSRTRRQPIGDAAIIEKGVHTAWAEVFPGEGERFLASFAVPGVPAALRNAREKEIVAALSRAMPPSATDGIETQQIKSMVEGMKDELRAYLAAGGTIISYGRRLVERQEQELEYYERAKNELDAAMKRVTASVANPAEADGRLTREEVESLWEKRNEELRRMGIRLLPYPNFAEGDW